MNRRDAALQGFLALGLVVSIVGGNFVLHRWMLGNSTSREADAGTAPGNPTHDDLDEFAPPGPPVATPRDPEAHRERLRKLIAVKLPHASADEQAAWLEELNELSLPMAEGVLDLRARVRASSSINGSTITEPASVDPISLDFGIGITR